MAGKINLPHFPSLSCNHTIKRFFVRCVFGDIVDEAGKLTRLGREIQGNVLNQYQVDYVVYVFGDWNEECLRFNGIKTKLVDKKNIVWKMDDEMFRHKLEVMKMAIEDFDEVVFLDWDCVQLKDIGFNFWEDFYKKEKIQANLAWKAILHSKIPPPCPWRKKHTGLLMNGGFLYLRDKKLSHAFIKAWENFNN